MKFRYDPSVDAGYVTVGADIEPGTIDYTERLGPDRFVDYDAEDRVLGYEFLNVRRGVDLSDLPHADELAAVFKAHGFRVMEGIGTDYAG
jgi:uncharacterized protein YuzE